MGNSRANMWISIITILSTITILNAQRTEPCKQPIDLVFAIDASGSVKDTGFALIKTFTKDIVRKFEIGVSESHVGVLTFSEHAEAQIRLTETFKKEELLQMIDLLDYPGYRTATDDALRIANTDFFSVSGGARQGVPQVLILLTDGKCTVCTESVSDAVQPLREKGVTVYVVGVTEKINEDELKSIASLPHRDHLFQVNTFDRLTDIVTQLQNKTCEVKTGKCSKPLPPFNCDSREEDKCYNDEECPGTQKCCSDGCIRKCKYPLINCISPIDIAFALDSSSSVSASSYKEMKEFSNSIVDAFQVSQSDARFSTLVYSERADLGFNFVRYDDATSIKTAINNLPHLQSRTRVDEALELAKSDIFSLQGKVRTRRPMVLIVFYDGSVSSGMRDLEVVAEPLKAYGVKVIAIGVGPEINGYQMRKIASDESSIFQATDFKGVLPEIYGITKKACNEKPGACEIDRTPIDPAQCVGVSDECENDFDCFGNSKCCKKGCKKSCTKPEAVCRRKVDIAFAVHQNLLEGEFELTKYFLNSAIDHFDIGVDKSHVALMTFGNEAKVVFDFNLDQSVNGNMRDRVNDMKYQYGFGRLSSVLELSCDAIFCANGGTRDNVPKMLVIITGPSAPSPPDVLKEKLDTLRARGVDILTIGIGGVDTSVLQAITSGDSDVVDRVLLSKRVDGIMQYSQDIADFACGEAGSLPPVGGVTTKGGCKPKTCYKGPKGSRGRPGKLGELGESGGRGMPGPKGIQGPKGTKGPDGSMGPKGGRGPEGLIGLPGFPGYNGIPGVPGVEGRRGRDGDCGLPGTSGDAGAAGFDGFPGAAGKEGERGEKGFKGPPAPYNPNLVILPGDKGDAGERGLTGFKGFKGQEGEQGYFGEDGNDGVDGSEGEPGDMGDVGTFIRQRGIKGDRGDPGPKGGGNSNVINRPSGEAGSKGPKGKQGEKGEQGTASIFVGIKGQTGTQGPLGETGDIGRAGLPGINGDEGEDGPKGTKGNPGPNGREGREGVKGAQGNPGIDGFNGGKGDRGDDAEPQAGPAGRKGVQGEDGITGQLGSIGRQGSPGQRGKQGDIQMGASGDPGAVGPRGPAGKNGMAGEPGMIGLRGEDGLKGNEGPRGQQGRHAEIRPGKPGMMGPPGPKGNTGPVGDTGLPGIQGQDVTISCKEGICPKGQKGSRGAAGDAGFPGPPGPIGALGFKGFPGGPCPLCPEGIQGESGIPGSPGMPGKEGEKGTLGDQGRAGPKGQVGVKGEEGFRGLTGEKGIAGDIGPIGRTGFEAPGLAVPRNGEKGSRGDDGKPGPKGRNGEKGEDGRKGSKGTEGKRGLQGDKGMIGETGRAGDNGRIGRVGQDGTKGDGIRGPLGDIGNDGPEGRQGEVGDPGPPGIKGEIGTEPTEEEMRRMKEKMSGDKGSRGSQGELGDIGDIGEEGPIGPRGPKGSRGPRGVKGFGGIKGFTGDKGQAGEDGDPGYIGFPGRPGNNGSPGENGLPGPPGPTPEGDQGERGIAGEPGKPGPDAPPPVGCFTFADPTDIAFLLDSSSSISDADFVRQKEFAKNILRQFSVGPDDTQAGIVKYGTNAAIGINFSDFATTRGLFDAIDSLEHPKEPESRLDLALKVASDELFTAARGAREDAKQALIIIGDGFINGIGKSSRELIRDAQQKARDLKQKGVSIFALGVGPDKNSFLLQEFVSEKEYYLEIDSYSQLESKIGALELSFQSGCTSVGDPGRDGLPGFPGTDGAKGAKGQRGFSPQGEAGRKGSTGRKGDAGFGIRGIPGDPGFMGFPGEKGTDGRNGRDLPGVDGFPGIKGVAGESIQGRKGEAGDIGPIGQQGSENNRLCNFVLATDILFLLDTSSSISRNDFNKMKEFVKSIVGNFDVDNQLTRVSIISYDRDARLLIRLSDYNSERALIAAIDRLPFGAGSQTRIDKALLLATSEAFTAKNGAREGVNRALVLMADGQQSFSNDQTSIEDAVKPLVDGAVLRYAIGIGREISQYDLRTIAGNNIILSRDYDTLQSKIDEQIVLLGKSGCAGAPGKPGKPGPVGADGFPGETGSRGPSGERGEEGGKGVKGYKGEQGNSLNLNVKGAKGDVGSRGPVGLPACSGQETAVATDLLFAIDASGSLYEAGFLQEKNFIKDVIDRVGPVTSRGLRVGAVVYSDDAKSTIPLNRYFTTASVKRAIDELPYDGKGTRMDLGLQKARELFSEQFGGRGSSKKVLILLTDGQQTYVPGVVEPSVIAKGLAADGVDIFSIGIGQEIDRTELESLISKPEHIFLASDISALIEDLSTEISTALKCEGGPRGPSGRSGDDGPPGAIGPNGRSGRKGYKGEQGDPGFGPQGEIGDEGFEGRDGDKGEKGFRGPNGLFGIRGIEGPKGYSGNPGEKGNRGEDGFIGNEGPDGGNGRKGARGDDAGSGLPGQKGEVGEPGYRGPDGDAGKLPAGNKLDDFKGDSGSQGGEGSTGPIGAKGRMLLEPGPIGLAGPKGEQGRSGQFGNRGTDGDSGFQGPRGYEGDFGPRGPIGEDGFPGSQGTIGDRGDAGDQGQRGRQGEPGEFGKQGKRGIEGERGEEGFTGFVGMPGKKGEIGERGPKGRQQLPPLIPDFVKGIKGFQGRQGLSGDLGFEGEVGEPGIIDNSQGTFGDKGDLGPEGPRGIRGESGLEGMSGFPGPEGAKGRAGTGGDPGSQGPDGRKGIPGDMIGGSEKGDLGEIGLFGRRGRKGVKGKDGLEGPIGAKGRKGRRGFEGNAGFPGLRGLEGPPGPTGRKGPVGTEGPKGQPGSPGPTGPSGIAEGFYVVRHSQDSFVPRCPRDYKVLWDGYSLMYTVGNGHAHSQDLGEAGSCSKSFSTLPFLFCGLTGNCKYASRNDFTYWLSGDVRQPMMPVSNSAIEPFISRCVVCEAPSVHIAVHSQDIYKPSCPRGWESLWDGFSFMMVAGAGKTGAGQSLSSSGSCLESFRPKPFIECQGARGTCHFFSDKYSFWLTTIEPSKQFQTQQPQTLSKNKGDDLTSRVSRCRVCVRQAGSGNEIETNGFIRRFGRSVKAWFNGEKKE